MVLNTIAALKTPLNAIREYFQNYPQIGGITKIVDVDIAVEDDAYSDGDVIGELIELTGSSRKEGGSGIIRSISIIDSEGVSGDIEVYFFTDTITPAADNDAFAPSASDLSKMVPMEDDGAPLNLATWTTINSIDISSKKNMNYDFSLASDQQNLKILLVANGAIDWTGGNDLKVRVALQLD